METKVSPYDLHVLVCTNTRANGEKKSCGPLGAEEIRAELKEWLKEETAKRNAAGSYSSDLAIKCRVNGSGCLDFCSKGIAIATYPFGKFLLNVDRSNLQDIKNKLMEHLDALERDRTGKSKTGNNNSPADF
jgi:hypothetical protein